MENRIVFLDSYTGNPGDLSWHELLSLGKVAIYERTTPENVLKRAKNATILIVNKVVLHHDILIQLPHLRLIAVFATGYNNIDTITCKKLGITICNVVGYGSTAVAQHIFALLLELTNHVGLHSQSVEAGEWGKITDFCYWKKPIIELAGKTLGIYGYGSIGKKVADIAQAFGMTVIVNSRTKKRLPQGLKFVNFDTLCAESDVISLCASMNEDNKGVICAQSLRKMKPNTLLINTSRGGLVVEKDLKNALENHIIAGAALDVLTLEPPTEGNILIGTQNCIITPHQAWGSREARARLLNITIENIKAFLAGKPQNVVN